MKLLDYFFFRVYSFYKNKRDSVPIITSCMILSLVLFLTILDVIGLIDINLLKNKIIVPIILLGFVAIFWRRYRNVQFLESLESKMKNVPAGKKTIADILIVIYSLAVLTIPILFGLQGGHVRR